MKETHKIGNLRLWEREKIHRDIEEIGEDIKNNISRLEFTIGTTIASLNSKLNKLNKVIENSLESADKLSKVGLILSLSLVLIGYSQIIVSWEGLSKIYLWGNIVIIGIFMLIYLFIFRKGKK